MEFAGLRSLSVNNNELMPHVGDNPYRLELAIFVCGTYVDHLSAVFEQRSSDQHLGRGYCIIVPNTAFSTSAARVGR